MYRAPLSDIAFTLNHIAGLREAISAGLFPNVSEELLETILSEAGRFAAEEIAPLNRVGDQDPPRLENGAVTMPPGWRKVYRRWQEAGWNALGAPEEVGGQALPMLISAAMQEMWNGASMAFGIGPTLTMGAIEALVRHAAPELQERYLPPIASGEWMATMNLTEPQAGSDLGALKTRAERRDDGSYRLFGQKIFITYGEHDLTDNIVHLVLARLPDAPPGSKGISLFLVPKMLPGPDGMLRRNDLVCAGLEHKLGIHGSPTCTMIYGDGSAAEAGAEAGAVGWLLGEEHRGLACMFTMMNNARLMVGVQGVGIAERALQQASAYAAERRQGRAADWTGDCMSPIIRHPDVRRMLLTMRGLTAASRAICYACAHAIDMAHMDAGLSGGAGHDRNFWSERADLLTPVAKAFATDAGIEVASLGVQVHGGMGYIEEAGAAQHFRDARIAAIYEGTNGIQAIDLVTRKLPQSGGGHVRQFIRELREIAERSRAMNRADFGRMGARLSASLDDLDSATEHLLSELAAGRNEAALAGATPYLRLFGLAAGGCYLAKGALAAAGEPGPASALRIGTARFFAERLCPETAALATAVEEGAEALLSSDPALLAG